MKPALRLLPATLLVASALVAAEDSTEAETVAGFFASGNIA